MKLQQLLKTTALSSALVIASGAANADLATELSGQEKIDYLIQSLDAIKTRLEDGSVLTVGAVGYAQIGGVINDDALADGIISSQELGDYLQAKDLVLTHDYAIASTAEQMFMQEYAAKMNSLSTAVDNLTAATSVIMAAVSVMDVAATADTKPEQVALQGMLESDAYSIDGAEVDAYNDAVAAVEGYSQQAGAFMAAANNNELTATVDNYAAQGNFMVGSYTSITYTQSIDEFVITWADSGFGTGFQGYLTPNMKTAKDVYDAGEYINTYGGYPTQ
jgi:hypothetical protein